MPKYAHLETKLNCPFCNTVFYTPDISDLVWFQWGFCRLAGPSDESMYQIGEAIRWKACGNELPPPWTYFRSEQGNDVGLNAGEPSSSNLVLLDSFQFQWTYRALDDPERHPPLCQNCGRPMHGAAIEIREGIIRRAWIYKPGEFDDNVHYYLIREDGRFQPIPEWEDYLDVQVVPDCSPSRLVTIHDL